jgi:hypothetical protein
MIPARSREVLPAPDWEYRTTSRRATMSDANSAISTCRPKNRSCSTLANGLGPTYGFESDAGGASRKRVNGQLPAKFGKEIDTRTPIHDNPLILKVTFEEENRALDPRGIALRVRLRKQ